MGGSLFDRLVRGGAAEMDEDESIRLSLLRMLTTRQGSVQALPEYGLPDLNDLSLSISEIVTQSSKAIASCIRKYEPRLSEVSVQCERLPRNALVMAFTISAQKRDATGRLVPWNWSVRMHGDKIQEDE